MLAELTIDLGSALHYLKQFGIWTLLLICLGTFLVPTIKDIITNLMSNKSLPLIPDGLKRKDTDRSSDQAPPAGFAAHLQIIEDTAPNATADVWWRYAKAEMTEAEVAIAEAKLARKEEIPQSV